MSNEAGRQPNTAQNPLGSAPLIPLIAAYAIPSVISMLVGAAYNITDQIFIGHVVGMLGNAATNVAFPTVTLTTGISMLFGIGTAANFSINLGAGVYLTKHLEVGFAYNIAMGKTADASWKQAWDATVSTVKNDDTKAKSWQISAAYFF
jgi:Na+-driven multidrug efflux pump